MCCVRITFLHCYNRSLAPGIDPYLCLFSFFSFATCRLVSCDSPAPPSKKEPFRICSERADELANKGRTERANIGRSCLHQRYDPYLFYLIKVRDTQPPIQTDPMTQAIKQASRDAFPEIPPRAKKPWVSNQTLKLIDGRKKARHSQQFQHAGALHKQIQKQARKDKKIWLEDAFKQGASGTARDQWAPVKNTRKGYSPKHIKLRWRGQVHPEHRRATVLSEQLADQQ